MKEYKNHPLLHIKKLHRAEKHHLDRKAVLNEIERINNFSNDCEPLHIMRLFRGRDGEVYEHDIIGRVENLVLKNDIIYADLKFFEKGDKTKEFPTMIIMFEEFFVKNGINVYTHFRFEGVSLISQSRTFSYMKEVRI